jgi:hypothetical protein
MINRPFRSSRFAHHSQAVLLDTLIKNNAFFFRFVVGGFHRLFISMIWVDIYTQRHGYSSLSAIPIGLTAVFKKR